MAYLKNDHEVPKKELNPTNITTDVVGATYSVPYHEVTDEGIVEKGICSFHFCKGSKADSNVPRQSGFFSETLAAILIKQLQEVNVGELASRETALAITNFEQGLMWLQKRAADRKARGVQGTYNK